MRENRKSGSNGGGRRKVRRLPTSFNTGSTVRFYDDRLVVDPWVTTD